MTNELQLKTCRDTIDRDAAKHGPYFDYIISIIDGTVTYDPSIMDDREYVKLTQAMSKKDERIVELKKQLKESDECLTIAYMQGFSDGKDKNKRGDIEVGSILHHRIERNVNKGGD